MSDCTASLGSLNGAHLDYDAERRLTHWQNAPSNPTSQAWYMYDGEGNRVEQYVSGGSGNHTYYLPGGVEEVTPSGSLIKYYSAGGMLLGLNTAHDASGINYLASDGLGSVSEALSPSGSATGAQLYSPYGGMRYSSGTMPTNKGFTGQYSDVASSGLDYYGARYYDPSLGQFTSGDTTNDGLNRYGYVKGNPETFTDPTGHRRMCDHDCGTPPPPATGGNGTGSGDGDANKVNNSYDPGSCGHDNPNCMFDKTGKCADAYTCEVVWKKAHEVAQQKADDDRRNSAIAMIVSKLLALIGDAAAGNLMKAVEDFGKGFEILDQYLVPIIDSVFGRNSWEAHAADTAIEAFNGLQTAINAFYGISFMAGAIMTALKVATGPAGVIVTVLSIVLGGVSLGAAAMSFYFTNLAIDDQHAADEIGDQTPYDWCQSNPGACGSGVKWGSAG